MREKDKKMESRLEKRIKSIRSLPQGQFNKYRQMFDSLMKTRCREKCKEIMLEKEGTVAKISP